MADPFEGPPHFQTHPYNVGLVPRFVNLLQPSRTATDNIFTKHQLPSKKLQTQAYIGLLWSAEHEIYAPTNNSDGENHDKPAIFWVYPSSKKPCEDQHIDHADLLGRGHRNPPGVGEALARNVAT